MSAGDLGWGRKAKQASPKLGLGDGCQLGCLGSPGHGLSPPPGHEISQHGKNKKKESRHASPGLDSLPSAMFSWSVWVIGQWRHEGRGIDSPSWWGEPHVHTAESMRNGRAWCGHLRRQSAMGGESIINHFWMFNQPQRSVLCPFVPEHCSWGNWAKRCLSLAQQHHWQNVVVAYGVDTRMSQHARKDPWNGHCPQGWAGFYTHLAAGLKIFFKEVDYNWIYVIESNNMVLKSVS